MPAAVVADLHSRRAQVGQRHLTAGIRRGPRRVGQRRPLGVDDDLPVQRQLTVAHHLQHPRRGVTLERRTHRERLTVEVGHRAAGVEVDGVHPDLRVVPPLQRLDLVMDRRDRFGGVGEDGFLRSTRRGRPQPTRRPARCVGRVDSPLPRYRSARDGPKRLRQRPFGPVRPQHRRTVWPGQQPAAPPR